MMTLSALYRLAEKEDIAVDCYKLKKREALSVVDQDGNCCIAIDPFKLESEMDEKMKLGHELGHWAVFITNTQPVTSAKSMRNAQTSGLSRSSSAKTTWIAPWPMDILRYGVWQSYLTCRSTSCAKRSAGTHMGTWTWNTT